MANPVAPATNVSSVPVVVVNTPKLLNRITGTQTGKSFRDHFARVAKMKKWEDKNIQAQHLMLALEGSAAEVLKEISDSSPIVLQDIWDALSRRFGEMDEAREALRIFEQRRQSDTESVVEIEQTLRSLCRVAWPKATPEQKEVALKTKFEEGLRNLEMQQYLRLHAMGTHSKTHCKRYEDLQRLLSCQKHVSRYDYHSTSSRGCAND